MKLKKKTYVRLLLDSGAFSAWTKQIKIDIKEYIKFIKDHDQLISQAINLDVIPGRFGEKRTRRDTELAASASYKNLQTMKDAGLKPLPVFHRGEDWKWLERMLKDGETNIGLSPLVGTTEGVKREWLDQMFSIITDSKGKPLIKAHGLGVTNPKLILRYPWHSVDSTSWIKDSGYGLIAIPVYENHRPNYLRPPIKIHLSDRSRANKAGWHEFGPKGQKALLSFFDEHGFELSELIRSRTERALCNLAYFSELEKRLPIIPAVDYKHHHSLLSEHRSIDFTPSRSRKLATELTSEFCLYHANDMDNIQAWILTKGKIKNRLVSYMDARQKKIKQLQSYVYYGVDKNYSPRPVQPRGGSSGYASLKTIQRLEADNAIHGGAEETS